jgi:hypothetical protein
MSETMSERAACPAARESEEERRMKQIWMTIMAVVVLVLGLSLQPAVLWAGKADVHVQEVIKHAKEGIAHEKEAIKHLDEAVKATGNMHAKEALHHANEAVAHAEQSLAHAEKEATKQEGK